MLVESWPKTDVSDGHAGLLQWVFIAFACLSACRMVAIQLGSGYGKTKAEEPVTLQKLLGLPIIHDHWPFLKVKELMGIGTNSI